MSANNRAVSTIALISSKDIILWETALTYLSCLVHETAYVVEHHAHARKLDSEMFYWFIQIINSIMKMRHELLFFGPKRYDLRYRIARIGAWIG